MVFGCRIRFWLGMLVCVLWMLVRDTCLSRSCIVTKMVVQDGSALCWMLAGRTIVRIGERAPRLLLAFSSARK
jgi:hypothetical protein